ncbi:MAG: lysoplasmalogenase [Lutisporaceae bacterium]
MNLQILIVIVFIITFAVNLYADKYEKQNLKALTKPLLVPLIMVFYMSSATPINWFIVTALFFGFIGDLSLLWGTKKIFLAIGLIAFLIGHLFYTSVFLQSIQYIKIVPTFFFIFLIPYILYGYLILRLLKPNLGIVLVPVIFYMCAILMMSFTSLCRIWNGFNLQFLLPFIGSLFFIASDSVLSYNSFIEPSKNYEVFIMFTYILAQILIVAGFLV